MALLNEEIQKQVREMFAVMDAPVKLVFFTQPQDAAAAPCAMCADTQSLLEELADLSEKISLEVHDFLQEKDVVAQYGIDKVPAVAVVGGIESKDFGIRFYGIPSGYEFGSIIQAIIMVSQNKHGLTTGTLKAISKLREPVHIQVLSTPTWPHCQRAVVLAHRLALASELITADMVEAMEFPELARKYSVYGVPRTVINEVIHIEGAVPEDMLVDELMKLLDEKQMAKLRKQAKTR